MSVAYRDDRHVQLAGQRPQSGGVAGVTDTRVPSSKTSDTPRAE